jgi:hypothetical protein
MSVGSFFKDIVSISLCILLLSGLFTGLVAAEFGHKDGPDIENIDEIMKISRQEPYSVELLISFGTSKGGSAGHLAIAVKDQIADDDLVYSANFYADRSEEHSHGYYTENLMAMIPKSEYLFKTTSSLGEDGSFGLDMGEVFKRSVIGIRINGISSEAIDGMTKFFHKMNDDYHRRATDTDYHDGEIVYDYMNLNCAKTVAYGVKYGLGFKNLRVNGTSFLSHLNPIRALKANVPTDMAMRIIGEAAEAGCTFETVLYKKYEASTYVNPHEVEAGQFKDMMNRFPSVLSLDYNSDQGSYEDYDNLYAMNLFYNLGRRSIVVDEATKLLKVEAAKEPMSYDEAHNAAHKAALYDKKHLARRLIFRAWGVQLGGPTDNTHLYDYDTEEE